MSLPVSLLPSWERHMQWGQCHIANTHCNISTSGNTTADRSPTQQLKRKPLSTTTAAQSFLRDPCSVTKENKCFLTGWNSILWDRDLNRLKKKNNPKKITESREETISMRRKLCQKKDKITHYWRKSHEEVETYSSPLCSMPILMISKDPWEVLTCSRILPRAGCLHNKGRA